MAQMDDELHQKAIQISQIKAKVNALQETKEGKEKTFDMFEAIPQRDALVRTDKEMCC